MQIVSVCHSCGRTIEKNFVFCPWCGFSQTEKETLDFDVDDIFTKLEEMQQDDVQVRVSRMNKSLDEIESALSNFIDVVEVER